MCVCLSETCCQKPLLTAPLASHDFVMSEEEREKKEITGKKKKQQEKGRWKEEGEGRRDGKRRSEGDETKGEAVEMFWERPFAQVSVLFIPMSS